MPEKHLSPEYTVTFTEGTYDVIGRCLQRVVAAAVEADATATTYENLAGELRKALNLALNLQSQLLGSLLRSNTHDGDVKLWPDGPESLFFRYDSGYHGVMILHGADTPTPVWSVHT